MFFAIAGRPQAPAIEPKYESAAALAAAKFGVDLAKYSRTSVYKLLAALPEKVTEDHVDALNRIVSVCSIGETMFMRHPEQFLALEQLLCTLGAARESHVLRAWSAGCATGEEAYSLAAVLSAHERDVKVVGTDVNAASIERGRTGRYRLWSMRGVDPKNVSAWLDVRGLEVAVHADIRSRVELSVRNLIDDPYPNDLDIIFCRNVLLYFHDRAVRVVLARLHDSLRPGGLLFLGYFDPTPPEGDQWSREALGPVCYFRKMGGAAERSCRAQAAAVLVPAPLPPLTDTPPQSSSPIAAPAPAEPCPCFAEMLALARALCGQGASAEALCLLAQLNQDFPLEIEQYVLMAIIAEESGALDTALNAARRAHFLASTEPMPQYLFGICLERAGESQRAELHLRQARRALDEIPDLNLPLPHGEGMTGLQLRRMIDAHLDDKK